MQRHLARTLVLALTLFGATAAQASPILFTMSITDGGVTTLGDEQGVVSYAVLGVGSWSYVKYIDALTPMTFAAVASGSIVDVVEFTKFDGAYSPSLEIGTYRFTNVLFSAVSVVGVFESGEFIGEGETFTTVPDAGSTLLLLGTGLAGLAGLARWLRGNRDVTQVS